jgi:hypothetical protein
LSPWPISFSFSSCLPSLPHSLWSNWTHSLFQPWVPSLYFKHNVHSPTPGFCSDWAFSLGCHSLL